MGGGSGLLLMGFNHVERNKIKTIFGSLQSFMMLRYFIGNGMISMLAQTVSVFD